MNRKILGLTATAFAFCSILSCSDKSSEITGIALNDSTVAAAVVVKPGTVTDLQASVNGSTSVTLSFTQVDDGTGQTAKYNIRWAVAPISWGTAGSITSGTCTSPLTGTATSGQLSCTVLGLTPATSYQFQLVPFRGTMMLNAVYGGLSNVVSATTTASAPPPPPPPAPVASVTVSPTSPSLVIGATVQLQVTARDANDSVLTGRVVTSSSADAAIASVNSLGLVSAVSVGTTPITVTSEGKSAIATVAVTEPVPAPVASVSVSPASSNLLIGATVQLLVTARDANDSVLTGRIVTSSSADAGIASVNSLGLVTAVSPGTTQITVVCEGQSAVATIIVSAPAPVPVASVSVSPATSNLLIGATVQLLVTARDANGNVLTGRVVTSSSANAAIASVNSLGLVTAVSAGSTQITVTSEGQSAAATINVSAPAPVNPGTVTDLQASVNGSTSVTLSFTQVNDGTGQPAKYNVRYAVAPISWGTAGSITSGTCTSPFTGTATGGQISCTVLGLTPATNYSFQLVAFRGTMMLNAVYGGLSNVVSAATTASAPVPVASVTVSPTSSSLAIGATVQLQVTAFDANNNVLTGRVVTSSSADPAIASVNSLGLVSAVSVGGTQVTVTVEGKSAIASITVTAAPPVPVATVSVSPTSSSLLIGATAQLSATVRDAGNNVLTGRVVTWSSANAAIATVSSSGLVRAVSVGTVQVTATSEGKSSGATITVTAPPPAPVATVSVSPSSSSLVVGATVQLSATTRDASNNVLTGRTITWSSSNQAISTVSGSGLVSAIAAGSATITALSETKTGTSSITVTAAPPPPPPGAWRANEPAGMTAITDRPFNQVVEGGFDPYGSTAFGIVSDPLAPRSPNNVMRATYPAGFPAGQAPAHTGIPHTQYSKIYMCFAVKLSSNWVGNGSGVNKFLYEWTTVPHPSFFFAAYGTGSSPLEPRVMFQDMVVSPNPGFVSPNLVPGARIIRGQWQTIEVYIQGNTAGSANGVVDWYLDGVHIGHVASGIQFSSGATAFNVFEIYPIWGGGNTTPAITATQTMDWDHLYVSGRN